jgi:hypothetical protein
VPGAISSGTSQVPVEEYGSAGVSSSGSPSMGASLADVTPVRLLAEGDPVSGAHPTVVAAVTARAIAMRVIILCTSFC